MNITKKIIIAVIAVLVLIALVLGGAMYHASKILTSDKLISIAQEISKDALPGAELKVKSINLSFGPTIKAQINNLNLELTKANGSRQLVSIGDAVAKIPLWAVITGGGDIKLSVKAPKLMINDDWKLAMGNKAPAETPTVKTAKKDVKKDNGKLSVPAPIANSRINIDVTDLFVKTPATSLNVDKFIIKKLGLNSVTAFELRSKIIQQLDGDQIAISPIIIGEFSLKEFLNSGKITSKLALMVNDINLGKSIGTLPQLKGEINVRLDKVGMIQGTIATQMASSSVKATFAMLKDGKIKIAPIAIKLKLRDFETVVKKMNLPLGIKAGNAELDLNGDVKIANGKVYPELQFKLTDGLNVTADIINVGVKANGKLSKGNATAQATLSLLDGIIDSSVKTKVDLNRPETIAKNIDLITKITNLNLDNLKIKEKLYAPKAQVKNEPAIVSSNSKEVKQSAPINLPNVNVKIEMANLIAGNNPMNGQAVIKISKNTIETRKLHLTYSGGTIDLKHKTVLGVNDIKNNFDFGINRFNLNGLTFILPDSITGVKGTISGKASGNAVLGDKIRYNVATNLRVQNGAIEGFKLGEFIQDFANKLPVLKGKDIQVPTDKISKIENLSVTANIKDTKFTINKFNFTARNKVIVVNGNGSVDPMGGPSLIKLMYNDTFFIPQIANSKTIKSGVPIMLRGNGFELKPDYTQAIKDLTTVAAKKQVEKQATKAINKLLEKNGQDPKKRKQDVQKLLNAIGI